MTTKIYSIKEENQTIRVLILEKSTKILIKAKQLKHGFVIIQDYNTGETAQINKNKLVFEQTI
jgi:hypothetical protein